MKISYLLKALLFHLGFFAFLRNSKPNPKIAILRYHAVVERKQNDYTSPSIAISPRRFERHVKYFAKNYNIISLDDAVEYLRSGTAPPANSVVITFDDGYADNYDAYKIMKKYQATGTVYLTAECIDRREPFWLSEVTALVLNTNKSEFEIELGDDLLQFQLKNYVQRWRIIRALVKLIKSNDLKTREEVRKQLRQQLLQSGFEEKMQNLMLTWKQVQEMQEYGMIFGAHTLTHLNLPNARPHEAEREISQCKTFLEKKLGKTVHHFSYPNSGPYLYFTKDVRDFVEHCGYQSAVTSSPGFADAENDFFALRRVRTVPSLIETVAGIELAKLQKEPEKKEPNHAAKK